MRDLCYATSIKILKYRLYFLIKNVVAQHKIDPLRDVSLMIEKLKNDICNFILTSRETFIKTNYDV